MRSVWCSLVIGLLAVTTVAADELKTTFVMDEDPKLIGPPRKKLFNENFKPLWGQALGRPENDMQRVAAETISQAHQFGFPKMTDFRPRLLEILAAPKTHPTTRLAVARALIVLETRDAAPALFAASQKHGIDLRQLIEPVLGDWKFQPIADVWRQRMSSSPVRHRDLMLALDGAARLGDQAAVPLMVKLVHDPLVSPIIRGQAAESAGRIQDQGLEPDAERLLGNGSGPLLGRLCAARLLARHESERAQQLLVKLAQDKEPSVVALALERLLTVNAERVLPLVPEGLKSVDPIVRQRMAKAYVALPNPERVVALTPLLDDRHPAVRGQVRDDLYGLTKTPEFDAVLRPAFVNVLNGESWRGQEQAALLLGALDHEAAAPRLIALLDSPRKEVLTTSAWAMKKLAMAEHLPVLLAKAQKQTELREKDGELSNTIDEQIVHLIECMGQMKYQPAEPLLRNHVPKRFDYGVYSRGAAIWALGYLHEGQPDDELAAKLLERVRDTASIPPETIHVQAMSAITIGRMKATSQLEGLREMLGTSRMPTEPVMTQRWAIMHMTGEKLPDLDSFTISKTAWFLSPLE